MALAVLPTLRRPRRRAWPRPLLFTLALGAVVVVVTFAFVQRPQHVRNFIQSRRLSNIPLTSGFHFDGTSSDLAQQFYRRHVAGDTVAAVGKTHEQLPVRIQNRLDALDLRFEKLPALLQRAVIWDSGYALDSDPENDLVKIYTVDGVPMSKIAIHKDQFLDTGCTARNCSDPNGMAIYRSLQCTGEQILKASLCASEQVTPQTIHWSMWATGGSDTMVPNIGIQRHAWTDPINQTDYVVNAVHTLSVDAEPTWETCQPAGQYSSLIVPCDVYKADLAVEHRWTEPQFGAIASPWLENLKAADRRHKVMLFAIVPLCILGGMVLVMVSMMVYYRRRVKLAGDGETVVMCGGLTCGFGCLDRHLCGRYRQTPHKDSWGRSLVRTLLSPSPPSLSAPHSGDIPELVGHYDPYNTKALPRRGSSTSKLTTETASMATSDRMTHVLLNDLNLYDKRVALERIHFQKQLSQGGFGEVWLCELDGQRVAVKRLLQSHNRIKIDDVEAFADEIQITASLHHANIPKFLGVAWTTLDKLCMVTEYMAGGDLQAFLKRCGHQLTWQNERKTIAIDIARALQYLHSRAPVMIHRDIKSRNILVRDEPLAAKVTDFGVSRSVQRDDMTLGVGTPYWTAPEVLDGTTYTEKSDIYSFGIVLSEIDTCQSPYHELQYGSDSAIHLQPFHILKMVISGTIQPRFSASCPMAVRELATKCLNVCPASRPTAREVVKELEQMHTRGMTI